MESERKRSRRTQTARPRPASMRARRSREVSDRRAPRRAIGREQIEHGGHPLDDTGAIVSIHMTLLLIAENNLYGRDGIRAVSDLQQMSSVPFVAKETRDSRNADGITASDDRCKPV